MGNLMKTIKEYINSDLHVEDGEYTNKTIEDAVIFGYNLCNSEWQEKLRWIPVDEEKPKSQKIVLIKVINRYGKERISLAQYVPPKTVLASDFMLEDDSECEEYDEVIDDYYVIEGWWEYQYEAETSWYIRDTVTHYREIIK